MTNKTTADNFADFLLQASRDKSKSDPELNIFMSEMGAVLATTKQIADWAYEGYLMAQQEAKEAEEAKRGNK